MRSDTGSVYKSAPFYTRGRTVGNTRPLHRGWSASGAAGRKRNPDNAAFLPDPFYPLAIDPQATPATARSALAKIGGPSFDNEGPPFSRDQDRTTYQIPTAPELPYR
ncbi:hypothetical protein Vqi01_11940 [Micromonospora qiuiae]|uniref:Uncharacterized protein n=1 Tax=Micromonospora qiuiae TaxID=502268 RepID=A0ABQ4J778_9ACTN|nr:hypothetical protein Vqi01_11940 [Micromonospora qiuiae]